MRALLCSVFAIVTTTAGCGPAVAPSETVGQASQTDSGTASQTTSASAGSVPPNPTSQSTTGTSPGTGDSTANFDLIFDHPFDGQCNIWQDDCPPASKCMPWSNDGSSTWNATLCAPLDPEPDQPGQTCAVLGSAYSGLDSCAAGAICWSLNADLQGTCSPFCSGTPNAPVCDDPTTVCGAFFEDFAVCVNRCDPLQQNCANAEACYLTEGEFSCQPSGSAIPGDACDILNDCAAGGLCVAASFLAECGGDQCCASYCDITLNECPHPDEACVSVFEGAPDPAGNEQAGVCILQP